MNFPNYKTLSANENSITQSWVLIDGKEQIVGRLASQIAFLLRGKDKPYFTPHVACGDKVIVINAEKVIFTGKKEEDKRYIRHTGYPGGQREMSVSQVRAKYPIRILEKAIKGMLPKNRLGRELFRNLYVYEGNDHPHIAQNPTKIKNLY